MIPKNLTKDSPTCSHGPHLLPGLLLCWCHSLGTFLCELGNRFYDQISGNSAGKGDTPFLPLNSLCFQERTLPQTDSGFKKRTIWWLQSCPQHKQEHTLSSPPDSQARQENKSLTWAVAPLAACLAGPHKAQDSIPSSS